MYVEFYKFNFIYLDINSVLCYSIKKCIHIKETNRKQILYYFGREKFHVINEKEIYFF